MFLLTALRRPTDTQQASRDSRRIAKTSRNVWSSWCICKAVWPCLSHGVPSSVLAWDALCPGASSPKSDRFGKTAAVRTPSVKTVVLYVSNPTYEKDNLLQGPHFSGPFAAPCGILPTSWAKSQVGVLTRQWGQELSTEVKKEVETPSLKLSCCDSCSCCSEVAPGRDLKSKNSHVFTHNWLCHGLLHRTGSLLAEYCG